ncbi:MAG TPA: TonB-dependent receptor [Caulobacteraceae bacterium]|nr:TonB-dependent receptor [Caulobacteraceae bacterium]
MSMRLRSDLLSSSLLAGVLAIGMGAQGARAQVQGFDIPSEPAVKSIADFARQSGLQVIAPTGQLRGVMTPAISGKLDARVALQRLLVNTGLQVSSDNGSIIVLRAATAASYSTQAPADPPAPAPARAPEASAAPTAAQSGQIEEVVVTVQRREEKLQNVPVAVTAFGASQLKAQGVQATADLTAVVPGLNFTEGVGIYGLPVIRGVGTTSQGPGIENPVATYIDGVYLASATSSLMSLADVSQVAVLKGPQGTLFGRNATGGLIQVTTKAPSHEFAADVEGTAGNLGIFGENLYLTGGLAPTLAANLAVSNDDQFQGFGRNLYTGQYVDTHHAFATRGKLLWQPDEQTDVTLSADYSKFTGATPVLHAVSNNIMDAPMPGSLHDIDLNVQPFASIEQSGESLTVKRAFDGVQLVSITAFRESQAHVRFDADATVLPILTIDQRQRDDQVSQELQLLSTGDHRFNWVVGGFFMSAHSKYDPANTVSASAPGPIVLNADLGLTSFAGFGQGTFKIDDSTNLTGGIRYSQDVRTLDSSQIIKAPFFTIPAGGPIDASKTFGEPTWRLSIDHRFSPELMAYASYNRGFRSGTFAPQIFPATVLKPEEIDAFEGGIKSDLFDKRLRFNAAAFYYDYRNRQVLAIVNGFQVAYDAPHAVSYGLDADATWQATRQLTFTAGVSAIHARYTSFPNAIVTTLLPFGGESLATGSATGNTLESTPTWTLNFGPAYRLPTAAGDVTASMNYYHNSGWFAGPDNRERQPAYDTVSADVLWTPSFSNNLTIRLWGKNLTDAAYAAQMTETGFSDNIEPAPGRTYGVTVGVHY